MSTTTPAKNYSGIPTRTEGAATPTTLAPNSDTVCSTEPPTSASPYNPTELAKALLALLGLLLGLTFALGGWQPHTSDARLGWSHGSISVVEGTDGDTGSRPLSPNDSGVLPADPGGRPVDLPKAYLGDSSRFAPGVSPWAGPVDA
mgnify:CR=1 FL=1|jgi:hypothetical protein